MMQSLRQISSFLILVILFGCRPDAGTAAPAKDTSLPQVTFPQPWTPTATRTATNTGMAASPTQSETRTLLPTRTPLPTETKTTHPTHIPTPTRGLPPSLTPGPKEECPPPTNSNAEIIFSAVMTGYGPQILEYIRAHGDRAGLEEELEKIGINRERIVDQETGEKGMVFVPNTAEFSEADVTGDQAKEIIVILQQQRSLPTGLPSMGIFIVGCREHQFQLLGNFEFPFYWGTEKFTKLLDILDLNANGIAELVVSCGDIVHGDGVYISTEVLEWSGTGFRWLMHGGASDPNGWGNVSLNEMAELRDIDGNGTTEVLLARHDYCGETETCWKGVYMWDGEYFGYVWNDPGDPVYRFQAAFYADYYSSIGLYDRSEALYRRAIVESSLKSYYSYGWRIKGKGGMDPDEPRRIIAYARFRLLELLVYLHKMGAAESHWQFIAANYPETVPGYRYAMLARFFWEAYQAGGNIGEACAAVKEEAARNPEEILDYLNYGEYQVRGPTLDNICPFRTETEGE
jgi:tetratricopeptide (TPR) repeat protein